MFRKSSSFDSRVLLLSGAVAAIISAAAIGLLDSGYRGQRARARKAIGHYADVARRTVRKRHLHRRMREPEAIAALVVSALGLAAACARLVIRMRGRTDLDSTGEDRGEPRIETLENVGDAPGALHRQVARSVEGFEDSIEGRRAETVA